MTPQNALLRLDALLRKAEIPIDGVGFDEKVARVDYQDKATPEQRAEGDAIASKFDVVLEEARTDKVIELREWWDAVLQAGVMPDGQDYSLAAMPSDIGLLTGLYVLAQTAIGLGIKTNSDTFVILDATGTPHLLNFQELTFVLLSYGDKRATLATQYVGYSLAINAATKVEELEQIIIGA